MTETNIHYEMHLDLVDLPDDLNSRSRNRKMDANRPVPTREQSANSSEDEMNRAVVPRAKEDEHHLPQDVRGVSKGTKSGRQGSPEQNLENRRKYGSREGKYSEQSEVILMDEPSLSKPWWNTFDNEVREAIKNVVRDIGASDMNEVVERVQTWFHFTPTEEQQESLRSYILENEANIKSMADEMQWNQDVKEREAPVGGAALDLQTCNINAKGVWRVLDFDLTHKNSIDILFELHTFLSGLDYVNVNSFDFRFGVITGIIWKNRYSCEFRLKQYRDSQQEKIALDCGRRAGTTDLIFALVDDLMKHLDASQSDAEDADEEGYSSDDFSDDMQDSPWRTVTWEKCPGDLDLNMQIIVETKFDYQSKQNAVDSILDRLGIEENQRYFSEENEEESAEAFQARMEKRDNLLEALFALMNAQLEDRGIGERVKIKNHRMLFSCLRLIDRAKVTLQDKDQHDSLCEIVIKSLLAMIDEAFEGEKSMERYQEFAKKICYPMYYRQDIEAMEYIKGKCERFLKQHQENVATTVKFDENMEGVEALKLELSSFKKSEIADFLSILKYGLHLENMKERESNFGDEALDDLSKYLQLTRKNKLDEEEIDRRFRILVEAKKKFVLGQLGLEEHELEEKLAYDKDLAGRDIQPNHQLMFWTCFRIIARQEETEGFDMPVATTLMKVIDGVYPERSEFLKKVIRMGIAHDLHFAEESSMWVDLEDAEDIYWFDQMSTEQRVYYVLTKKLRPKEYFGSMCDSQVRDRVLKSMHLSPDIAVYDPDHEEFIAIDDKSLLSELVELVQEYIMAEHQQKLDRLQDLRDELPAIDDPYPHKINIYYWFFEAFFGVRAST